MTIDKERLRVLAEAATPGPWTVGPAHTDDEGYIELPIFGVSVRGQTCAPAVICLQFPYVSGMQEANADLMAAARDAIPALLSENAALVAEVERLRGIIKVTTAIAITMLFDSRPEDVKRTFSVEELEKIVGISEPLQDQNVQVEDIYRHAWGAAMADKGGAA